MGEAVAGGHVEPRVLDLLELRQPLAAGVAARQLGLDLLRRASFDEGAVDALLDGHAREPAQLGVGAEQEHVDPRHHLGDVLVGDVGQVGLAQLDEGGVGAVAEQQELEVVLPHEVAQAQAAAVGVEHLVEGGVAVGVERDLVGLILGQAGDLERVELGDERAHLVLPLVVQLRPVGEVVARALLEVAGPLGHLVRIGDGIAGDVDVPVDDPVVDAHRRRDGEHAVLPRAHRLVGRIDADDVERRMRDGEVHRVPEPEAVLVRLAAPLVEERVVGVHLLPALAPLGGRDLVRAGE